MKIVDVLLFCLVVLAIFSVILAMSQYTIALAVGESMQPTFGYYHLHFLKEVDDPEQEVSVNDIVAVENPDPDEDAYIEHRVIDIYEKDDHTVYEIRGDNNKISEYVIENKIEYKYIETIGDWNRFKTL